MAGGALNSSRADTFPKLLIENARVRGDRPANREKDLGIWLTWSWSQIAEEVKALACGLKNLGVEPGDKVILLGEEKPPDDVKSLAGSEYLEHIHGIVAGKPSINIKSEIAVQKACRRAINDGIIRSAHDCSDGGLAVAIAECCIASSLGFVSTCTIPSRWDSYFFGEAQSRILVTINEKMQSELEIVCTEEGVNWTEVGYVDGTSLKLRPLIDINIDIIINSWHKSIEQSINFESA